MAHYQQISDVAVQCFSPTTNSGTNPEDPTNLALGIHFLPKPSPDPEDLSPFVHCISRIEQSTSVISTADFKYCPDPAPGAHDALLTAISDGNRIATLHCYCEPVAYELLIPIRQDDTLPDPDESVDRDVQLARLAPLPAHWFETFSPLEAACPIDLDLQRMMIEAPQNVLRNWIDYYQEVLHGACHTALNAQVDASNDERRLFVVELERRLDRTASIHVAYTFRVASCATVPYSGLRKWLRSRSWWSSRFQEVAIVSRVQEAFLMPHLEAPHICRCL